jgi:SprT-like family
MKDVCRESWLRQAVDLLAAKHTKGVLTLPDNLQVSVGFPFRARGKGVHTIGQCWPHEASKDGRHEIFISPILDDPARVIDVLLHEMIHAGVGCDKGHGSAFRQPAIALGLTGKMTATVASPELLAKIAGWLKELPPYPHAALTPSSAGKKQGTRLLKCECPDCGYLCRVTAKWIEVGFPTCPCGTEMIA